MLVALPVSLILLTGAMYLWQVKLAIEESLPAVIRDYARQQAKLEVSIDRVQIGWHALQLWNIRVGLLTGAPLLQTRSLQITYPRAQQPMTINVERPQIWLQRNSQGLWNIDPLLKQPPPEEPVQIQFRLLAREGTLHFEDLYPRTPIRDTIAIRTLHMIQPLRSSALQAEGRSSILGDFTLEALSDGRRWWLSLSAPQMRAEPLQAYLPVEELKVSTIRTALNLQLGYEPEKPLWIVGYAEGNILGATFRQKPLPYNAVQFAVNFTESWIAGQLRAQGEEQLVLLGKMDWAQSPIHLTGQIDLQGRNPQALLRFFDIEALGNHLQLSDRYHIYARFHNTVDAPQISAQVQLARVKTARGDLTQVRFPLLLKEKQIWIPEFNARYLQHPFRARLYADLRSKEPLFRLQADIKDFSLNLIDELKEYPISGNVEAHLIAWGRLESPIAEMNLTSDRVVYNQSPLGTLRARLRYENNKLQLPFALIQGALGTLQIDGGVDLSAKPRLDLALTAHEVELNRIAQMLGYTEGALIEDANGKPLRLDGIGYATLQLRGTMDAPEAIAEFAVFDGRLGDIGAEITAGTLMYSNRSLLFPEVHIFRRSAQVIASGVVNLPQKPSEKLTFQLSTNANDLDLQIINDWMREEIPLAGIASAQLHAEGTPEQFMVSGTLNTQKAQVDKLLLQQAEANFTYERTPENQRLVITDGRALIGDGQLKAEGWWQNDNTLYATWSVDNLPLKEIAPYLPADYALTGAVSARGHLGGTLDTPEAQIELWTTPLELNRVAIGTLEGFGIWHSSQTLQGNLRFNLPEGEVEITDLRYNPDSHQVVGTGSAKNVPVTWLHRLASAMPLEIPADILTRTENVSGTLNLALQLDGTTETPRIALDARLDGLLWEQQPLGTLTIKGQWQGEYAQALHSREVRLDSIHWLAENTRLEGSALWTPESLQADVELNQFPLGWVRLWDPSQPTVQGSLDISLLAGGHPESPTITLSATFQNLEYAGQKIDQILFSQIDVREGRIETADALIRVKDYQARLSGYLPFHWSPAGIAREEPLAVEIRLTEQPLRILELFAPIDMQRTDGTLSARLQIEGTLDNLQPRGTLTVQNGTIGLEAFQTALESIGLQVEFDGAQARIVQATARSSFGGNLRFSGTVDFTGEKPQLALEGTLQGLALKEPRLPFGGSADGTVNGQLSLTGEFQKPTLQASLQVLRGTLNLPAEIMVSEGREPLPVNPQLDVRVDVGEDFHLRNPNLDTRMEGVLVVGGTLESPVMDGTFRLRNGALNLPTARLRIEPESLVTVRYPYTLATGEIIARIYLDVRATTSVVATDLTGDPTRYRVEVDVRGPLDDPERLQLNARSEPPGLSEQRILTLLGRGTALSAIARGEDPSKVFREQLSDILTAQVLPTLFAPLETEIAEAFDLEQFSLDYSGLRPASVYLVKNLFNGVGITYRRSLMLGPQEMYEVRLFYRLPFRNRLLQRMRIGVGFDHTQNRFLFIEGTLLFR